MTDRTAPLSANDDPGLERLNASLRRLHQPAPPPQLRRSIAESLARQATAPAHPRRRPLPLSRRFGLPLLAILAVTALAAAAPLVASIVDRAFGMHPGTARIVSQQLGTPLDLSQTANGFTVTIERVYADANQIAIGYSVSGPAGRTFNNFLTNDLRGLRSPTLSDVAGREFRPAPVSWGAGVAGGKGGYLKLYDGSTVEGRPAELALHLTIPVIGVIERGIETFPAEASEGTCAEMICTYTVEGPYVFDFTVPFEQGRVVEPHQTIDVGGVPIILERVASTPTGTQITLRGTNGSQAVVILTSGGASYRLDFMAALVRTGRLPDPPLAYGTPEPLAGDRRDWTLTVETAQGTATFTFTLP